MEQPVGKRRVVDAVIRVRAFGRPGPDRHAIYSCPGTPEAKYIGAGVVVCLYVAVCKTVCIDPLAPSHGYNPTGL